jgi:hypothetical protein
VKPSLASVAVRASPWLALVVLAGAAGLQKIRSFDYWWHLRTGQLIAETGRVPRVDLYTFSAEGERWIDIHWLFQLLLHELYQLGGHDLVLLAKVALVFTLLAILGRIGFRAENGALSVAFLALLVLLGGDRFMPRPEMLSFVLLATVLYLLDRFERCRDSWIYAIVPVQLLWVNLHGLFALGIALCAMYLGAAIIEGLLHRDGPLDRKRLVPLGAVTILSCLSALASPNGLDAAVYPFQQLAMIGTDAQRAGSLTTQELASFASYWPAMAPLTKALMLAVTLLSLAAMIVNRRRLRMSDALCWLAFLALAAAAVRNLVLFAIVATPISVRNWNESLENGARLRVIPGWISPALAALLLLIAADVSRGRFFARMGVLREPGLGVMEVIHPVAAVDWIDRARPEGPIFHSMVDGGYLTWRLYPDYRTLVDGRLETFGPERKLELNARLPRGFRALDEKYHFNLALLNFGQVDYTALLRSLHRSPEWRLVFVDDVAAVFQRRRSDPMLNEVDVADPSLLASTVDEHSMSDAYRGRGRIRFFRALGQEERAREIAREMIERYPERHKRTPR